MRLNAAIFLDRDGTLNRDLGYVHKIADWQWLPGAIEGLRLFKQAGYLLVVASNQSGIARGYYDKDQVGDLENWVNLQLQAAGVEIASWRYCPHRPDAGCLCRKPAPGMLLEAAENLSIDLASSWMVGDKVSDVEAGLRAGCRSALIADNINTAECQALRAEYPDLPICGDLLTAAKAILAAPNPAPGELSQKRGNFSHA